MELFLILKFLELLPNELVKLVFTSLNAVHLKLLIEAGGALSPIAFEVYYKNIHLLNRIEVESENYKEKGYNEYFSTKKEQMVKMNKSEFIEFCNSNPLHHINCIEIEATNLLILSRIPQILNNITSIYVTMCDRISIRKLHEFTENTVSLVISPDEKDYVDDYEFPSHLKYLISLSGRIRNFNNFLSRLPHLKVLDLKTCHIPLLELNNINQLDKLCIPSTCFSPYSQNIASLRVNELVIYYQKISNREDENLFIDQEEDFQEEYYIEDALGNSTMIMVDNDEEANDSGSEDEFIIINDARDEELENVVETEAVIDLSKSKKLQSFSYFNNPRISLRSVILPQNLVKLEFFDCGKLENLLHLDRLTSLKQFTITAELDFESYIIFLHRTVFPLSLTKLVASNKTSKRELTELAISARRKHPDLFIGFLFQVGENFSLPDSLEVLELHNFSFVSFSHWWKIPRCLISWKLWEIEAIETSSVNDLRHVVPNLQYLSMHRVKIEVLDNFYLPDSILDVEFSECSLKKINHTNLLNLPNLRSLSINENILNRAMPLRHEPLSINNIAISDCDFTSLKKLLKLDLSDNSLKKMKLVKNVLLS